jgi:hypothetical protein
MSTRMLSDTGGPGLILVVMALSLGALLLFFFVIVLLEGVVLRLVRWDNFKRSLWGSFLMNLASTLAGFLVLYLVPRLGILGLAIAWVLSFAIETFILIRMKPDQPGLSWRAALAANTSSYLLLLLPAYLLAQEWQVSIL